MIFIFGFGKDYQALRRSIRTARILQKAQRRPRRMPLEALARWLSE